MSRRSHKAAPQRRLASTGWIVGILFLCTLASQARVHLISRQAILTLAEKTKRFTIDRTDYALRGSVFSANGKPLAQSADKFQLGVDFRKVPQSPSFFMELSVASGISASEFEQYAYGRVKRRDWPPGLSYRQAEDVQKVRSGWRADGVSLRRVPMRSYPYGSAMACVLGVIRDGKPASGLELSQNEILQGRDGLLRGLVDRAGAYLPMRMEENAQSRMDGKNITLTIDTELQQEAARAIRDAVILNKAQQGVAIVVDPKTGDLLAMANWPSFDPNGQLIPGQQVSDFNPGTMAGFEPGSTFKILTLAKALEEGKVAARENVYCRGELAIGTKSRIRCDEHNGSRAHGSVDPETAIAKSCNVSAATWALRVGKEKMIDYIDTLGLTTKPGIGLPLEARGKLNRNDPARALQTATLGFGQSMTASPVSLASAFSMFANGGVRMKPRLIKRIGDKPTPMEPGVRIVRPETAETVSSMMESVIESDRGTGSTLRIAGYRLSGKTGTAQKLNSTARRSGHSQYVSSFVGFVPAQQPRAVILVMVDNPAAGKYYGATVAGPVFHSLAQAVIKRYEIQPTERIEPSSKRTAAPPAPVKARPLQRRPPVELSG